MLFNKATKNKPFLVLDIGTEAIKSFIFKKDGEKIVILGSSLKYFNDIGVFDSWNFEHDVVKKAISEAVRDTQKEAGFQTKRIWLGGSFLRARVVFLSFSRKNHNKEINKKESKAIHQTITSEFRKKVSQKFVQDYGILPQELEFLSSEILETKIDGYQVNQVLGYKGKKLEFRALVVFVPRYEMDKFLKIFKELKLKISNVIHNAQCPIFPFKTDNEIFLDIGGNLTQIFLVKNRILEAVSEFKNGGKDFSQTLCKNLSLSQERVRFLKEKYSQGLLSDPVRKKVKGIFSDIAQNWFENLKSKLSNQTLIASNIFLCGGGSLLPDIQDVLEERREEIFLGQDTKIKFIFPKGLNKILNSSIVKINNSQYTSSILLSYYEKTKNF
ncbi:MAG: hypothetical protein U9P88_00040 [Patescibacteria group bacterium]|nr:hypothetical protein [Patescibacteria group bacterium]